jgi:ABC-type microcin C transport system permease subunit YejB
MKKQGETPMELPESDIEFLEEKEYKYTLVPNEKGVYLIISNFHFPEAYIPREADLLINIIAGYPNTPLDMFYTNPTVKLVNGNLPNRAGVTQNFNNTAWQQWSRHYVWRLGIDNLRTFISSINNELTKGQ